MSFRFFIQALLIILIATSCSHYYYTQSVHNVPLFKEKNEFHGTVALGVGVEEISTTEIQTAYAISDKFAVMANFLYGSGASSTNLDNGSGSYFEAAFGYYKPITNSSIFEVYGGIGTSQQHHQYSTSGSTADLGFNKIFIQPSIGLSFKVFDFALTSRFAALSFYKVDNMISFDFDSYEYNALEDISQNSTSLLWEPGITVRMGWKQVKLQMQVLGSKNLSHEDLNFEGLSINAGLYITLAKRYSK